MVENVDLLDEAFERMAGAGFELPNGFVNHGAMACEALATLGFGDELDSWARRFSRVAGAGVEAAPPTGLDWQAALGDYRLLPEWIGLFERALDEDGWPDVIALWVPRLMPALSTALFHGAIRVGHATRAIEAADTPARREELARALGYWAARYSRGAATETVADEKAFEARVLTAAAEAARYYLADPNIYLLHGVTGAMALDLLVPHLHEPGKEAALAQLAADHRALFAAAPSAPVTEPKATGVTAEALAKSAEASRDAHQVKVVEASLRALRRTGDPVFAAAAETVTGLGA